MRNRLASEALGRNEPLRSVVLRGFILGARSGGLTSEDAAEANANVRSLTSTAHSNSGSLKRGVEFKGGSLHDGFGGFEGSEEHLALLCWSYKIQHNEATVAVLAVSAVMAVSVMTATPLKLNPPFSVILTNDVNR